MPEITRTRIVSLKLKSCNDTTILPTPEFRPTIRPVASSTSTRSGASENQIRSASGIVSPLRSSNVTAVMSAESTGSSSLEAVVISTGTGVTSTDTLSRKRPT